MIPGCDWNNRWCGIHIGGVSVTTRRQRRSETQNGPPKYEKQLEKHENWIVTGRSKSTRRTSPMTIVHTSRHLHRTRQHLGDKHLHQLAETKDAKSASREGSFKAIWCEVRSTNPDLEVRNVNIQKGWITYFFTGGHSTVWKFSSTDHYGMPQDMVLRELRPRKKKRQVKTSMVLQSARQRTVNGDRGLRLRHSAAHQALGFEQVVTHHPVRHMVKVGGMGWPSPCSTSSTSTSTGPFEFRRQTPSYNFLNVGFYS
jgi:hypothetical protein